MAQHTLAHWGPRHPLQHPTGTSGASPGRQESARVAGCWLRSTRLHAQLTEQLRVSVHSGPFRGDSGTRAPPHSLLGHPPKHHAPVSFLWVEFEVLGDCSKGHPLVLCCVQGRVLDGPDHLRGPGI